MRRGRGSEKERGGGGRKRKRGKREKRGKSLTLEAVQLPASFQLSLLFSDCHLSSGFEL